MQDLFAALERIKKESKAPGTRKQYKYAWNRFVAWSLEYDRDSLPASVETIDLYLAALMLDGKGVPSARMGKAAIADKHVAMGLSDPTSSERVSMTLAGIQRLLGRPAVQARGLTKGALKGLVHKSIGKDLNGGAEASLIMWREAWRKLTCFLTLARFSDLQRVQRKHVHFDLAKKMITIEFTARKNDQNHVGFKAYLLWHRRQVLSF